MNNNDLPPITNYPAWIWRVIRKIFVELVFAIGSLALGLIVFPLLRVFKHNKISYRRAAHKAVSYALDFYIHLMSLVRISTYKINDLKALRSVRGCVIVANHPSMLDVIYILAFVRDAVCIVKAGLKKSLVSLIVNALYITNNIDFEIMQKECAEALQSGSNLIIFRKERALPATEQTNTKKARQESRSRPAPTSSPCISAETTSTVWARANPCFA